MPGSIDALAERVSAEVAAPAIDAGVKDAVMPSGTLDVVTATGAVKPFSGVVEMVYMALLPARMLFAVGFAATAKSPLEDAVERVSAA